MSICYLEQPVKQIRAKIQGGQQAGWLKYVAWNYPIWRTIS